MSVKEKAPARWAEPKYPRRETKRPYNVQEVLRTDSVAPASTLLTATEHDLGTEPLDASRYYSKAFHDLEVSKMWSRTWQWAVWSYDIPSPGDISVYRLLNHSVIIVRQPDMSVKAFVNSCLHRGRELCDKDMRRNHLRCPYHGFAWNLEGDLKHVPAAWDFPQVKPEEFHLPEVRCEEWNGFIFVNFDDNAPPLREYMGKMYDQWEAAKPSPAWDFTQKYKAAHLYREINCNWKTCMEAFIEGFHVAASHSQLLSVVPETSFQYDIYPDEPHFSRFHSFIGMPSTEVPGTPSEQEILDAFTAAYVPEVNGTEYGTLKPGETARQALARMTRDAFGSRLNIDTSKMAEAELIDGTAYFLFPNFMPWPSLPNPIVYRFRPLNDDPDWCIWETLLFLPFEGERPPSCDVTVVEAGKSFEDYGQMGALDLILQQDAEQLPFVQNGLKAGKTQKVTLGKYQEARIRHYHRTIDSYIERK